MKHTIAERINRLFYVHTNLSLAVFLIVGTAVELLCGMNIDHFTALWIAYPAAGLFSIIALCIVWSVIRWERRYAS